MPTASAERTLSPQPTLSYAMVVASDASGLDVEIDGERFEAKRAIGCLVAPRAGDTVLVAVDPVNLYVLSVLTRADDGALELRSDDRDLRVTAPRGRLSLGAQEGIDLTSGGGLELSAGRLQLTASTAELLVKAMTFIGREAAVTLDKTKLFSRLYDAVHERFTQRANRSMRTVEQTDVLRAEAIDYSTEKTTRLHSETTVVTASDLVKVDGRQIHLG